MTEMSQAAKAFLDSKPQLSPEAQAFMKAHEQRQQSAKAAAVQFDPDQYAKALKDSRELGLPVPAVQSDPAAVQNLKRSAAMKLEALKGTPELARMVKNLDFAAVAQDDLENLSGFERFWKENFVNPAERGGLQLKSGSNLAAATQAAKKLDLLDELEELEKTDRAAVLSRVTKLGDPDPRFNEFFRTDDPAERQAVRDYYERVASRLTVGAADAIQKAQAIPQNPELMKAMQGDWSDVLAAVVTNPDIILQVGIESMVQTLPGMVAAPFTGGASMGLNSMIIEKGGKIAEILQEEGVNTQDPQAILAALKDPERRSAMEQRATAKAVPVALFDTLSMGLAGVKMVPKNMTGLKAQLTNMGAQIATQGAAGAAGEATGQLAADGEINSAEVMLEAVAEAFSAIPETATMGSAKLVGEISRYREAKQVAASLAEAVKQAEASKLRERSPEDYAQFVNQATKADALISAKEFSGFFQSQDMDPQDAAEELGVLKSYVEALNTGGDVPIKLGDLLAKVAGNERWKALMQHVRMKPDSMSAVEALNWAQEKNAQFEQEANRILAEVSDREAVEVSADKVAEAIAGQLEAAGQTPQTAKANAALHRAFAIVTADRLGVTPEQVYERFGLSVTRGEQVGEQSLEQAKQSGYEGADMQEASAWNRAVAKGLDMSKAARMERARAMGFDVENVAYHATTAEFSQFDTSYVGSNYGQDEEGFFFSSDPDVVSTMETPSANRRMDVFLTSNLQKIEVNENPSTWIDRQDKYGLYSEAKDEGFDGLAIKNKKNGEITYVVFNPANIRSINAAFDPDEASSAELLAQSVSTRIPTAKKALENPLEEMLVIGLDAAKADPVAFKKNVDLIRQYPNFRDTKSADTPEKAANQFISHVIDNLLWIYDQVPEKTRQRSKLWYDGARNIVDRWVEKYSVSDAQVSGMLAVLSPQKDWFQNVSLAERVLDVMSTKQGFQWSDEMTETALSIGAIDAEMAGEFSGQALGELDTDWKQAVFVRVYDQTYNERGYRIVSPEGDFGDFAYTASGKEKSKTAWGSFSEIGKAVSIFNDGSIENISNQLGGQHKVRNFYNNIFNPNSEHGDVTIDTHAVAAALLRPLAGASTEVLHNFGSSGASSTSVFGAKGTYGIYAEAYRKAAEERGVLPREMQSITWEAVRGLFTAKFKGQAKNVEKIDKIWDNYKKRRISLDEARKQVSDAAKGINPPDWAGPRFGRDEAAWASSYTEELRQNGRDGGASGGGAAGLRGADSGQALNQQNRGAIDLSNFPDKATIALFQDADLTTFLHESGHFFFEVYGRLAMENADIRADTEAMLKWAGYTGTVEEWLQLSVDERRAVHEKVAEGFETYLFEGKAPTPELQGLFNRFRTWLLAVYRSLTNMRVKLSDDVRLVFDRMLATQDAIDAAQRSAVDDTLFESAEQAGMTAGEFADYQKAAAEAKQDAINRGLKKAMADIKRMIGADRQKIRERVTKEVQAEPANAALYFLKRGKAFTGELPEGLEPIKLSKQALTEMYGDAIPSLPNVGQYSVYTLEGGTHPDMLAPLFGFESGDALVKAISKADPEAQIKARVIEELQKLYGDLNEPGAIENLAQEIVHNQISLDNLYEEYRRLARQQNALPMDREATQAYAEKVIAGKRIREIQPHIYEQAAQRAGRKAQQALRSSNKNYRDAKERSENKTAQDARFRNNIEEAAYWKRTQIINNALAKEAHKAKANAKKTLKYLKGFDRKSTRERIGKASRRGGDYLEQIDGILDRYDLRPLSKPEREKLKTLGQFVASVPEDERHLLDIPESVLERLNRVNWQDITSEEFQGVKEAVQNIAKAASDQNKLLASEYAQNLDAAKKALVTSITANASKTRRKNLEPNLPLEKLKTGVEGYLYMHRRLSSLVHQMDGGKDRGVMWNLVMRPINKAGDTELAMMMDYRKRLTDIYTRHYSSAEMLGMKRKRDFGGHSFTKHAVLAMALNSGTQDNRQKMMVGLQSQGVSNQQVEQILNSLDERDWQFVQDIWTLINELWPAVEAKQKRVYGVAPDKVQGMPVQTKFGVIQGGYYPLKYGDYRAEEHDAQNIAQQMMSGAFSAATTKRGHTKARVENVNRLIRLDLGVIEQHLSEAIHDLTHHEMLIDMSRLLKSAEVRESIITHYGDRAFAYIKSSIDDVAAGDIPAKNEFEKGMSWLRNGVTVVGMGWSLSTALLQPLGLTNSIVRIGARWVGEGLKEFYGSPSKMQSTINTIREQSPFMAERMNTQTREIADVRGKLKGDRLGALKDSYFWLITRTQLMVDVPTWIGAYRKAMSKGTPEKEAIAFADQAVIDAQGSGTVKDLAAIQRGGPMLKLFTNFASYFITTWNLQAQKFGNRAPGIKGQLEVMGDFLLLYTIPAAMGYVLNGMLKGFEDDDLEDPLKTALREQGLFFAASFIGVRDAASATASAFGYSGPSGTRFFTELEKLSQQIQQGEADMALAKATANTAGILFHLPTGQVMRTIEGTIDTIEGESDVRAIAFGPQRD